MTTLETSLHIAAPIDVVWLVLTNYEAFERWNPYIIKIEGEARAGTTIIVHSKPVAGRKAVIAHVEVVSVAPFTMRWEGGLPDRSQFKGDHWFVLESNEGGTLLKHFEHFSGTLADNIVKKHGPVIEANFTIFNIALRQEALRIAS